MKVQGRPCRYGVFDVRCGKPAATKRQRPAGGETWEVCQEHADFLDRLRTNIEKHADLLERLGD